jgi:hypothetical protein
VVAVVASSAGLAAARRDVFTRLLALFGEVLSDQPELSARLTTSLREVAR